MPQERVETCLAAKSGAHCKTSKSFIKPTHQGQICGGRSHTVKGIKIPGGTETGCGGTEKGRGVVLMAGRRKEDLGKMHVGMALCQ